MGGKAKIDFYGFDELLKKLEKAGANVNEEIINALKVSSEKPKQEMINFMTKHKRTGNTLNSWEEEIKENKNIIKFEMGFNASKGGLPAIFLNVGTPRIQPYFFIDNAVNNNLDEIKKAQEQALLKSFKELL